MSFPEEEQPNPIEPAASEEEPSPGEPAPPEEGLARLSRPIRKNRQPRK